MGSLVENCCDRPTGGADPHRQLLIAGNIVVGISAPGYDMKLSRRRILQLAAGTVLLPTLSRIARAQAYPTLSVRIISGYPLGIAPDVTARLVAQSLSERLAH
jgi:hypothetical protein